MRNAMFAFVFGLSLLQLQAVLPAHPSLICTGGVLALCFLGWLRYVSRFQISALLHAGLVWGICFLLGFGWAGLRAQLRLAEHLPTAWEGQDIVVTGIINNLPVSNAQGTRFQFQVEAVEPSNAVVPSQLSLAWYSQRMAMYSDETLPQNSATDNTVPALHPGERWRLPVRLKRPHGNANPHGFDYELWLLEQGVRATGSVRAEARNLPPSWRAQKIDDFVWSWDAMVERSRDVLRERIYRALPNTHAHPQPYRDVLVALVVGEQRGITQDDWQIFNRTGIGHLISISGLHITMLAGLAAGLASWLWRHSFFTRRQLPLKMPAQTVAAAVGFVTALLYCWLAGFQVPAQRTLYMLGVVAIALLIGRRVGVITIMAWALFVVGVLDPWAVLSPGFWLSFGAVGLILYATQHVSLQKASTSFWGRAQHALANGVRVQWAVTLGLVPLTLLLFQQVSVVSPLANAVAIPLVSMVVTPLALLGSVLPSPFAIWVLGVAHELLVALVVGLTWLSELSWAVWRAPTPSLLALVLASLAVMVLIAPGAWRWGLPSRWLVLPLLIPLLFKPADAPPSGEFRATVLDVGQGTAVMIETAQHRLLYDTGPMYSLEADAGNRVLLPWLHGQGVNRLDMLMLSHQDADHVGGAASLLEEIPVDVFRSSLSPSHVITALAHEQGARVDFCERGQRWTWEGVNFEVLHPDRDTLQRPVKSEEADLSEADQAHYQQYGKFAKTNAKSCTVRVSNGAQTLLLTGDIEAPQEAEIIGVQPTDKLLASILLVPHHGSMTSSTTTWLDAVKPGLALVQAGYRNRYGHPKDEVMARYQQRAVPVLETVRQGAVQLETQGVQLQVNAWRIKHRRYWMQ